MDIGELEAKKLTELRDIARELNLPGFSTMKKVDLVYRILEANAEAKGLHFRGGLLEIVEDDKQTMGFLRTQISCRDGVIFTSPTRRFVASVCVRVIWSMARCGYPRTTKNITASCVWNPSMALARRRLRNERASPRLRPFSPDQKLKLETVPNILSTRLMDLVAPIGRGQRGLIVSPPKAGKTTVLKDIANGLAINYQDIHLMIVLIGERPEEVTDIERSTEAEVVSSTFDEPVKQHCRVAEMALERAKRLVESGQDVVILLDSITRLARAYNLTVPPSGRTLSGGLDPGALYPPKRFFGSARNVEFGGSLTIIGTCLVDTGSRMDDVIYEEFKGTGNMELLLSRRLQERRIFPAFDIERSSTRREDLLLSGDELARVYTMRQMLGHLMDTPGYDIASATQAVLSRLRGTKTNYEFLETLTKDMM
jgi:transcription termination factor Rho